MKNLWIAVLPALMSLSACSENEFQCNVIPEPAEVRCKSGSLDCSAGLYAVASDTLLRDAADYLNNVLAAGENISGQGRTMQTVGVQKGLAKVSLSMSSELGQDAYRLKISRSGVSIEGGDYGGVINGIATLRQLLWEHPDRLPLMKINDSPRFIWRGAMLDVSRHFFTVAEVTSLIDEMALYKLNRLHLHLTDDQGWRIEIKSLPELTGTGAWRTLNNQDKACIGRAEKDGDPKYLLPEDRIRKDGLYGGFYTQEQMRSLIAYAAARGIEIIPEIDLPGHSLSILRSYPQLSCDGRGGAWGTLFSTPLCVGNDDVLAFCKKVLDEIFEIFPSEYVHVGGDEVERTAWEQCPKCAARVRDNGLGGTDRLQAWFTMEMESYCTAHGKRLIGWDEVAGDGLSKESVVMWWRNWSPESREQALREGHDVIICPSEYYYLTDEQDRNSLASVYGYEPDPETSGWAPASPDADGAASAVTGSGPDEADSSSDTVSAAHEGTAGRGRVIGVQGNLWTEQAPTVERAGERIFPRLLAIAEAAWVTPERKDLDDFMCRLPMHLHKLNEAGWKYRMPDVGGICDRNVIVGQAKVELTVPEGAALYYTLDGSVPDTSSALYTGPFTVSEECVVKYRCYNSRGVAGDLCEAEFVKSDYLPAAETPDSLSAGLLARWYDYAGELCSEIDSAPFNGSYVCDGICIPEGVHGNIGLIFDGCLEVPEDGVYQFYTYTDDGSLLWIDGQEVVSNDFGHSRLEKSGQAALRKGLHRISLRYFDHNGGILQAGMILPDGTRVSFSPEMFFH